MIKVSNAAPRNSILALEFSGIRSEQSLRSVLPAAFVADVVSLDPLMACTWDLQPMKSIAETLCRELMRCPRVILASCTAAHAALSIAVEISRGSSEGRWPTLILVEPQPVTADHLRHEFARMFIEVGGDPRPLLATRATTGVDEFKRVHDALISRKQPLIAALGNVNGAESLVADLFKRYTSWLRYLAAGIEAPPARPPGRTTVLTVAEGWSEPSASRLLADPRSAEVVTFNSTSGAVLRCPAASRFVEQLLAANVE